jgi:hypothetical protein
MPIANQPVQPKHDVELGRAGGVIYSNSDKLTECIWVVIYHNIVKVHVYLIQ